MPAIKRRDSDSIRQYVLDRYIEPARRRGEKTVQVAVGEVHRALRLHNRAPLVCSALRSKRFLRENGLSLERTAGPASGQSTTVVYTYGLPDRQASRAEKHHLFLELRGVAAEMYREFGGGEAFLKAERSTFIGDERSGDTEPTRK
ncbi:MAG: hypothetical protein KIT09_07720 [Bryobacteraceae bacterium]|nr:hypothetical protein [Bryobacteraceae bacterium]